MASAQKWNILTTLAGTNRGVANATSANSSGAAVDLDGYVNPGGRRLKAFLNIGNITSTGTILVSMQDSTTTGEAGFANITGATFTSTASSGSLTGGSQEIHFRTNNRYVRAVGLAANTAQVEYGVYIMAELKVV